MHNTKIKKDQKKIKQSKTIQKVSTKTTEFLFCLSFICWLEAYLEMWLKLSNTPLEKSNFFSLQIGTNCRLFLDWRSEPVSTSLCQPWGLFCLTLYRPYKCCCSLWKLMQISPVVSPRHFSLESSLTSDS